MAHVLIHLNVPVSNDLAEKNEEGAIAKAKLDLIVAICENADIKSLVELEKFIALAEVVDYDSEEEQ